MKKTLYRWATGVVVGLVGLWSLVSFAQPNVDHWQQAQLAAWDGGQTPEAVLEMRAFNPEWDFMSRTFLVLTLADQALADPSLAERHLAVMDAIVADTLQTVNRQGSGHYLMSYANHRPFVGNGRSVFVDGEILVMINARRMVRNDRWADEAAQWQGRVVSDFGSGSTMALAESYPDEGWMFCHVMAMLGLRMSEVLDGDDHSALRQRWLTAVRTKLIDSDTGMLVSEFSMDGTHFDGPEGSSIWLTAVGLQLIDPTLAAEQYALARDALGAHILGMGYAREWPKGVALQEDVDSGPIVPIIDASASSSGFAIVASTAFGDRRWHRQLTRALGAATVLMSMIPALDDAANNPVGQSVVLWGLHFGPLWEAVGAPTNQT